MNSKIKHFTKLTALLFFLILAGCQKEDLNQSIAEPQGNVIKSYTFKQATQKTEFSNAYNKVSYGLRKINKNGRDSDSNFIIKVYDTKSKKIKKILNFYFLGRIVVLLSSRQRTYKRWFE